MYNLQYSTVGNIVKEKAVVFNLEALLQIQWTRDLNPYFHQVKRRTDGGLSFM